MALILAWPLKFPIFFLLGYFALSSASRAANVFHFDTEGSSAAGSQEDTLIRGQQQSITFGSWPHVVEVQQFYCLLTFSFVFLMLFLKSLYGLSSLQFTGCCKIDVWNFKKCQDRLENTRRAGFAFQKYTSPATLNKLQYYEFMFDCLVCMQACLNGTVSY